MSWLYGQAPCSCRLSLALITERESPYIQVDDLHQLFGKYGQVEDAFIPKDRETGQLQSRRPLKRIRLVAMDLFVP